MIRRSLHRWALSSCALAIYAFACVSAQAQWITAFYDVEGNEPISAIPWSKVTHVDHGFIEINSDGSINMYNISSADITNIVAGAHAAGKKVMIAVGDSTGHSWHDVTANSTILSTAVSHLASFVNSHGYDGIDIDWEQNQNVAQFESLLAALRAALPRPKILAVDALNSDGGEETALANQQANVDQINAMCYDFDNLGYTWYNTAVFGSSKSATGTDGGCIGRIKPFLNAGVAASKMGYGLPFYGRHWTGTDALYQTSGSMAGSIFYNSFVGTSAYASRAFDSAKISDYVSLPSSNEFYSFTGLSSIDGIVSWAKSQGLGGYMTYVLGYEYTAGGSGDARYPLSTQLFSDVFGRATTTAPSITTTSPLSTATVGASYTVALSASGSTPITWAITSGTLPTGLSLNSSTGVISGTPTMTTAAERGTSGASVFTIQATNSVGNNSKSFSLTVVGTTAPTITTTSPLSAASVNAAYSTTLTANGTAPITWGVTSGTLPTGLSLNSSTGVISGTPTVSGTSTFTVQATNSAGNNSKSLSLTVGASLPVISSFTATPSTVSAGSSTTLAWSTTGATSLSIDQGVGTQTGTSVSVTPNGTTAYTLSATNSGGTVKKSVTVTVAIAPDLGTPQPAAMPGRVPTDSDLLVAADHCQTTLSANVTSSTLSLPVASLSACVANQVLFMDSEQVKNCSGASNVFTVCAGGRNFAGTAASAHQQGALVWGRIGGVYHNQTSQELIALATWIGTQAHHGTYPGGVSVNGASWPNHLPTKPELYSASDWTVSQLSAAMGASDVSMTVKDGTGYQANQIVAIDKELMELGSASGATLGGLLRGISGTTPATHATGASVFGVIAAIEFNVVTLNLHAIEADLYGTAGSTQPGVCGTSCAAVSGVSWPNHVFLQSEAGIAVANGAYVAAMQNRVKDEIKALANDLKLHP